MDKPIPKPTAYTLPFWEGCLEHNLKYQTCRSCGAVQLLPSSQCTQCYKPELEWKQSCGRGVVLSHTTVHRAPTPAFKVDVPYVIAIIDMEEGFRLMANVRGAPPFTVNIGQRIHIGFERRGDTIIPIAEPETS